MNKSKVNSQTLAARLTHVSQITAIRECLVSLHSQIPGAHWALDFPMILGSAAHLRSDRDWSLYLARVSGRLVSALFGYADSHRWGFARIPIYRVGTENVGDFLLARDAPPAALCSLIGQLLLDCSGFAFVEFAGMHRVPRDQLLSAARTLGLRFSASSDAPTYEFDVSQPSCVLNERMSPRLRRNLRSQRKRLQRQHRVEFEDVSPIDATANDALLRRFVDLEMKGWKGSDGGAIGCDTRMFDYYRSVTALETERGAMRWFTLLIDGQPAAMYMCVQSQGRIWAPKTSYDHRFAMYSPGNELLARIIDRICGEDGVTRLCMITGPSWLRYWHPISEDRFRVRIFPNSIRGLFCSEAERLLKFAKAKRPSKWGVSKGRMDS